MTKVALSGTLDVLAKETENLADLARYLDRMLPAVVSCLPEDRRAEFTDLQRIDTLFQHLQDLARVFRNLSVSVDGNVKIDERSLAENLRLEHFKALFEGPRPENVARHSAGQVQLF